MTISSSLSFLTLLFFACLISLLHAEIIHYNDHALSAEAPQYIVLPKYDKTEVPHWSPGNGHSFFDLSRMTVRQECADQYGEGDCKSSESVLLEYVIFRAPVGQSWSQYWTDGNFCCSPEAIANGVCFKQDTLVVPSELPEAIVRQVIVTGNNVEPMVSTTDLSHHDISKSGSFVLLMANCQPDTPDIVLSGYIESMNPYGYLPAELFGDIPFYLTLSILYFLLTIVWSVLCWTYWDQILPLQHWVTAVLVAGLLETSLVYGHFMHWNDFGVVATGLKLTGAFFGVMKRSLSRVLVQLVALGYGVVRPSLGEDMKKVMVLGVSYFCLSLISTFGAENPSNAKSVDDSGLSLFTIFIILLAVVDTTFYVWTFTSINALMTSLASRKQAIKYLLYRNFRNILVVLLLLTCLWAVYGSVLFLADSSGANDMWRAKWTVDALWEAIYFLILLAVAVLWAPSKNSQRYAYAIELTQLAEDEEYQSVAAAADMEGVLDAEYGSRLHDDQDPFLSGGSLDVQAAASKRN